MAAFRRLSASYEGYQLVGCMEALNSAGNACSALRKTPRSKNEHDRWGHARFVESTEPMHMLVGSVSLCENLPEQEVWYNLGNRRRTYCAAGTIPSPRTTTAKQGYIQASQSAQSLAAKLTEDAQTIDDHREVPRVPSALSASRRRHALGPLRRR